MTLMGAFSRVDEKGAVAVPENMRREVGLKAGQLAEMKVVGTSEAKQVLLSKGKAAR